MFGSKNKVTFQGNNEDLIVLAKVKKLSKNTLVEVPKGYETILVDTEGKMELFKNRLEFKLQSYYKYLYFVKSYQSVHNTNWGTRSRIQVETKENKIMTLGSYGNLEFQLMNPSRYINTRMQGKDSVTAKDLTEMILDKIPEFFQETVSEYGLIDASNLNKVTIGFKKMFKEKLSDYLEYSGIELVGLVVENINLQDTETESV